MAELTDKDLNKDLHRMITGGEGCWHWWEAVWNKNGEATHCVCSYCGDRTVGIYFTKNPDYLNDPEDWRVLLEWAMGKWKGWKEVAYPGPHYKFNEDLLIPMSALGKAIGDYEREER